MRRNGHPYKTREDRDWEDRIKAAYINSNGPHFGDKPLIIAAFIHRKMPKTRPKYMASEMDTFKPDADNILKSIEDALNGIAYYDDKQVIAAFPVKLPRIRWDGEAIEIIISDEIDMDDIVARVKGIFE